MDKIIIATIKSFNIERAQKLKELYSDEFDIHLIVDKSDLTLSLVNELNPKYIFFPHWSWYIQDEIFNNYNAIVFHTGNLPEDRGGSPIQNQIINGKYKSHVCAIRVAGELDAGDVYLREPIDLSEGTINDILEQVSRIIFDKLIPAIIKNDIKPIPQVGTGTVYTRRKPFQSSVNLFMNEYKTVRQLYDFVRMLDGEGYPKAYIDVGSYKFELSDANIVDGQIRGVFTCVESKTNSDTI